MAATLDIIGAVSERGLWHVLANIFDRVAPEDIRAATAVSIAWREVHNARIYTPCPTVHLILCTYFNSGMAGPITMTFYVVKVWTLRFCIKYSSIGYMPICGVNNGATFGHWKKVIFGISRKFASFKRQFLR